VSGSRGEAALPRRTRRVRRSARAGTAVTVLVALAACSHVTPVLPPAPSPTASVGAALHGSVTFWDAVTSPAEQAAYATLVARFEQVHPQVHVAYVPMAPAVVVTRFRAAAVAAAGAPDLIRYPTAESPLWAGDGFLTDLTTTVGQQGTSDFAPAALTAASYDGHLYALPQDITVPLLAYNRSLFARAHIKAAPTTWPAVERDADALRRLGVAGLALPADPTLLLPFLYGEGGDLLNVPARTITVSQPSAVYGLQERLNLQASGASIPVSSAATTAALEVVFRAGRAGMLIDTPAGLAAAGVPAAAFGVAEVPGGSLARSAPVSGDNLGLYAGSQNPGLATALGAYLNSSASQALLATAVLVPARISAWRSPAVTSSPLLAMQARAALTGTALPPVPEQPALLTQLATEYLVALQGTATAQQAMTSVATSYESTLPTFSLPSASATP